MSHHWALNTLQNKFNHKHNIQNGQTTTSNQSNNTNDNGSDRKNISIVVPHQVQDPGVVQRE